MINFEIARVQLLAKKRQTIIAILGVCFGISMFILMISFMKGTNKFIEEAMLASTPDINVFYENNSTSNEQSMISKLEKENGVLITSPVLSTHALLKSKSGEQACLMEGVDILKEEKIYHLDKLMKRGKVIDLHQTPNGVFIGNGLSDKLGASIGDSLLLFTSNGQMQTVIVVGVFQFGLGLVDNFKAFCRIQDLRIQLIKDSNAISSVHLKLIDNNQAATVASEIKKKYGFKAEDWAKINTSVLATNLVRDLLTYVVSLAMLIVAGFGIYNIMNMTISSKMKDIAILKAQGFTSSDIVWIFLSQSLFIGMAGGILGIIGGFFFSYLISRTPFPESDIVHLDYYPVVFEIRYYFFGVLFGMLTTLLAGLFPSLKASKMDPVAILRG